MKSIPLSIAVGVAILSLSLMFKVYGELLFYFPIVGEADNVGFELGRALIPFSYYALHAFLLFKIFRGRNWARIVMAVVVALNTAFTFLALSSFIQLTGVSPVVPAIHVVLEVSAIIMLLASGRFFEKGRNAA